MSVNILVYEHVIAGGLSGEIPAALADAGQAMWQAAVDDFAAAGCKVWTTSGDREDINRDGRAMSRITPAAELDALVRQLAAKCDAAIIIAPETDGILARWVKRLETMKVPVLNCSAKTIGLCGDKLELSRHLAKRGVATPPARAADAGVLLDAIGESLRVMGGAYVIKPRDGAGCESTFVCRVHAEAEALRSRLSGEQWIVQPFVEGIAASVSFIADGEQARPLLAGRQLIEGGHELHYLGGELPLPPRLARRAVWLGEQALATLRGLRGFIGVDVVLADAPGDDVVIEINPRLTVSYCGLRSLCMGNLAAAMMAPARALRWRRRRIAFDNAGRVREDA